MSGPHSALGPAVDGDRVQSQGRLAESVMSVPRKELKNTLENTPAVAGMEKASLDSGPLHR